MAFRLAFYSYKLISRLNAMPKTISAKLVTDFINQVANGRNPFEVSYVLYGCSKCDTWNPIQLIENWDNLLKNFF